jgi:hypothetical protein
MKECEAEKEVKKLPTLRDGVTETNFLPYSDDLKTR